jgi:exosortase/archaeosortase family protein
VSFKANSKLAEVFRASWMLLIIPLLELIAARAYLHSFLNLRIGFIGTTDFDYFLPAPTAFFILLYVLGTGMPLVPQLRSRTLAVNLSAFFCFLALNHFFLDATHPFHLTYLIVWSALLVFMVLSSLFIWIDPAFVAKNPKRLTLIPCALVAFSVFLYMNLFPALWGLLEPLTATVTGYAVHLIYGQAISVEPIGHHYVSIIHPLFTMRVGAGCGGGDGFFYFTLVLLIWKIFLPSAISVRQWLGIWLVGLGFMFFLNIARILTLYALGLAAIDFLGEATGKKILFSLFHLHAGWVLYSFGIFCYIQAATALLKGFHWGFFLTGFTSQRTPKPVSQQN